MLIELRAHDATRFKGPHQAEARAMMRDGFEYKPAVRKEVSAAAA